MATTRKWFIRNIAEVPWRQFPDHFGGALSKPLVMPETAGSQHIDYRISMYQPMAYVKVHQHKVQEQVYHVIEGEGLMHIDGEDHVVRKHDYHLPAARRRPFDLEHRPGRSRVPGRHLAGHRRDGVTYGDCLARWPAVVPAILPNTAPFIRPVPPG